MGDARVAVVTSAISVLAFVLTFVLGILAGCVITVYKLRDAACEIVEHHRESLAILSVLRATVRWMQMPAERRN